MAVVQHSLCNVPAGSVVRIEKLCDCPKARGRLCALGLTPGTFVEVCSGGPGPCLLKVRGSNLALGNGMARRVLCSMVNGKHASSPAEGVRDPNPCECMEDASSSHQIQADGQLPSFVRTR